MKKPFVEKIVRHKKLKEKVYVMSKEILEVPVVHSNFSVGELVEHSVYGEGFINKYNANGTISCSFGKSLRNVQENSLAPIDPVPEAV